MKKLIAILAAMIMVFTSAALAEELAAMTDEELLNLYRKVQAEMESRNLTGEEAADPENEIVRDRLVSFFMYWSRNELDEMLTLCTADWMNSVENAKTELFGILMNRTPLDMYCGENAVYGNPEDPVRRLEVTSRMDRHNGKDPVTYRLQILMQKQEDGLWYVNPQSLVTYEIVEGELPTPEPTDAPAEPPAEVTGDTVLYYFPAGGEYYHLDPNCKRVNEKYTPLEGRFTFAQLGEDAYKDLKPCEVCGAPAKNSAEPEKDADQPQFTTFGEALDAAEGYCTWGPDPANCIALVMIGEKYYRVVADTDEKAKELNDAAQKAEEDKWQQDWDALEKYVRTLPVSYTEEITAVPAGQEELDALAGKKLDELDPAVWMYYPSSWNEEGKAAVVELLQGVYQYEAEVSEPYEVYLEHEKNDTLGELTIRSVSFYGLSARLMNLQCTADGNWRTVTETFEDYDLMLQIADKLAAAWAGGEPDAETKEAIIEGLTAQYPEAADMIREMVETFSVGEPEE